MNIFQLVFYNINSLIFCFRIFPFLVAVRRPVLIHPCVRVKKIHRGGIVLKNDTARLIIGFNGTIGQSNCQSILSISETGKLIISGLTTLAKGSRLIIDNGNVELGCNFFCNGDCFIRCTSSIKVGDNNMWGWNIMLNTSDGHYTFDSGAKRPLEGTIVIGRHVWLTTNIIVAKNTEVASECVVAQGTLVTGKFSEEHCLIGGVPAKIIKRGYSWKA